MRTQAEKAAVFCALHERPGAFIIPNPWDVGTAKLLEAMGFEALATTSLGLANMLGRAGSHVTQVEVIDKATDLPVNADLENCFVHDPVAAAEVMPARSVVPSRITPAIRPIPSTNSTSQLRAYARRRKSRAPFRCHSC